MLFEVTDILTITSSRLSDAITLPMPTHGYLVMGRHEWSVQVTTILAKVGFVMLLPFKVSHEKDFVNPEITSF